MIDNIQKKLSAFGRVRQRDMGRFASVKKGLTSYTFSAYETAGTVRFSVIRMKAFFGLMKMESLVVSPLTKDAPMMSADYIRAFGKETLILEFYDLTLRPTGDTDAFLTIRDSCRDLPDTTLSERWYDTLKLRGSIAKKGKKLTARYADLCERYAKAYIDLVKNAPDCEKAEKQSCLRDYVEGMFVNGSPTVEVFSRLLDRASARELYGRFLFASED